MTVQASLTHEVGKQAAALSPELREFLQMLKSIETGLAARLPEQADKPPKL